MQYACSVLLRLQLKYILTLELPLHYKKVIFQQNSLKLIKQWSRESFKNY